MSLSNLLHINVLPKVKELKVLILLYIKRYYHYFAIIVILISAFVMFNSWLSYYTYFYHPDEIHTIQYAYDSLIKENSISVRILGGTRWFVRAVSPISLYYMVKNQGGEVFVTGWDWPALNYFILNYKNQNDPSIQDFNYSLRVLQLIFILLSFYLLSLRLWDNGYKSASMLYPSMVLINDTVFDNLLLIYPSTLSIAFINIIFYYILSSNINFKQKVILSLSCGAFLSLKIASILFLPVFIYIYLTIFNRNFFYVVLTFLTVCLLWYQELTRFRYFVHAVYTNIHHHLTGHLTSAPNGMYMVNMVLDDALGYRNFGVLPYLTAASCCVILFSNVKNKTFIIMLIFSICLILMGTFQVKVYFKRNYIDLIILMNIISFIGIDVFLSRIFKFNLISRFHKYRNVIIIVLLITPVVFYFFTIGKLYLYVNEKFDHKLSLATCKNHVDVGDHNVRSFPEHFNLRDQMSDLRKYYSQFDCLIVNRINENKQLTNYLLSKDFNYVTRRGPYFLFKK
jgi:hypothetical protein